MIMKKVFLALVLFVAVIVVSCTVPNSEKEKQAFAKMPVLDSLINASMPFSNRLKLDEFKTDLLNHYKEFEGKQFTELDSLDFKIDAMTECEDGTIFIALKCRGYENSYSYILRITSYIDKNLALSLDETIPYRAAGILKTAPDKIPYIDGMYAPEIDLGIFSLNSLQLTSVL